MASASRRGTKFMGLFRDAEGRQRSAGSFATKKEALKAARLAEADGYAVKTEAAYPSKIRGKVAVAEYAAEWFGNHAMSPHTRYAYDAILRVHILPTFGGRVMASVTTADIRSYSGRWRTARRLPPSARRSSACCRRCSRRLPRMA
jgi:hypothetical protein